MFVRAKMKGYHGMQQYNPGDVFELLPIEGRKLIREKTADGKDFKVPKLVPYTFTPEEQFSDMWMELVEDEDEVLAPPKPQPSDKKAFGAKKPKPVGYAASAEHEQPSSSTGDQKVI